MKRIAKIIKSKVFMVACILFLAGAVFSWLNYPQIVARLHLRVFSPAGIENINYECDNDGTMPSYYIGFDISDATCLQKIIDRLSLEKLDFFVYAGRNPPDWWPKEITGRGETDEVRRVATALRASGDLITYNFNQEIKDPSVGKAYLIELYHYPKKKQAFYVKRWVGVILNNY